MGGCWYGGGGGVPGAAPAAKASLWPRGPAYLPPVRAMAVIVNVGVAHPLAPGVSISSWVSPSDYLAAKAGRQSYGYLGFPARKFVWTWECRVAVDCGFHPCSNLFAGSVEVREVH